jgi:iron complex outermembrane receptor protein
VADKDRLAPEETPTGGYSLLGGEISVEREQFGRDWDLHLRVRNALNCSYRDFLSRYKDFADNPGVDVSLRLGTAF